MEKPLRNPRSDLVFKLIFGDTRNLDILQSFLQAVLDLAPEEYERLELANPVLLPFSPDDKLSILDVKVYTKSGIIIDVEIQLLKTPAMKERIVFYSSKLIAEQMGKGEPYAKMKKVANIVITDYILIPDNKEYHTVFRWRNREGTIQFTDIQEINILELPKLPIESDSSRKWEWLSFLKRESEEELVMLAEKSPEIKKAVYVLKALSEDERTRMLAEAREKAEWDQASRLQGALEEGEIKSRIEITKNAIHMGLPIKSISELTGLSEREIENIKEAMG